MFFIFEALSIHTGLDFPFLFAFFTICTIIFTHTLFLHIRPCFNGYNQNDSSVGCYCCNYFHRSNHLGDDSAAVVVGAVVAAVVVGNDSDFDTYLFCQETQL